MTKHTPTPWRVEASTDEMDLKAKFETGSKVLIVSDDCEYHPIADCSCNHSCRMSFEQEANAAFIIKAANSYYEMVEALKQARDRLQWVEDVQNGKATGLPQVDACIKHIDSILESHTKQMTEGDGTDWVEFMSGIEGNGWIDEVVDGIVYGRFIYNGEEVHFSQPLLQVMEGARVDLQPGSYITILNGQLAVNNVIWTTHDVETADQMAEAWSTLFNTIDGEKS